MNLYNLFLTIRSMQKMIELHIFTIDSSERVIQSSSDDLRQNRYEWFLFFLITFSYVLRFYLLIHMHFGSFLFYNSIIINILMVCYGNNWSS